MELNAENLKDAIEELARQKQGGLFISPITKMLIHFDRAAFRRRKLASLARLPKGRVRVWVTSDAWVDMMARTCKNADVIYHDPIRNAMLIECRKFRWPRLKTK